MIIDMMIGAIALASRLAGLFFLRFWRSTGDRFFLYFALSFGIEGFNRLLSGITKTLYEDAPASGCSPTASSCWRSGRRTDRAVRQSEVRLSS